MKITKDLFSLNMLKKKKSWIPLAIVLIIVLFLIFKPDADIKNIVTETAKYSDLKQTILATGQIISSTDLNLSFNTSGIVKSINFKVGEKVRVGQVLASLDQAQAIANLTSARGTLAAANARLKKVLEGSEVALAELALENTKRDYENVKKTQETLVKNAYNNLLNSTPDAVPAEGNLSYSPPTISGTYNLEKEGFIYIKPYPSTSGMSFYASGLVNDTGQADTIIPQPMGNSGLYIKFPAGEVNNVTEWVIEIPNKKASTYLSNYNAYQSALKTQQSTLDQSQALLDQRQTELDLRKITAGGSEIDLVQADVLSARGQVEQAQARYNDTRIVAPADGTITSVDIKIGELAPASQRAIVLQDVSNMYIESNVNEANIAGLSAGLPVEITLDAFGPEKIFTGVIVSIDPSSTLISGVVNYKIKVGIERIEGLKSGMTANMTIKVSEKKEVISVPTRSILTDQDGRKLIRIIIDSKNKKYSEVLVTTGLSGDGGLTEITSGLSVGDEYVVLIKTQ